LGFSLFGMTLYAVFFALLIFVLFMGVVLWRKIESERESVLLEDQLQNASARNLRGPLTIDYIAKHNCCWRVGGCSFSPKSFRDPDHSNEQSQRLRLYTEEKIGKLKSGQAWIR